MKITDKNGIYDLGQVVAVTATNDKERTAVLYFIGGERINTVLSFDAVAKLYNPPAEAAAPAAPAAAPEAAAPAPAA